MQGGREPAGRGGSPSTCSGVSGPPGRALLLVVGGCEKEGGEDAPCVRGPDVCVRARGLCEGPGVSAMGPWGGRFPVKDVLGGRSRWAGATTARRRTGVRWGRPVPRAARLPGRGQPEREDGRHGPAVAAAVLRVGFVSHSGNPDRLSQVLPFERCSQLPWE